MSYRMESISTSEASLPTRLKLWFEGIPFTTRCVFLLCLSLYLTELLFGWDPNFAVCLHVPSVIGEMQIYRIFTAAFFHVGLLHVTFNMLAFIPVATDLERRLGSVKFSHLIFLIVFLGGILYTLIALFLSFSRISEINDCSIGFSGVIFGLILIYTQLGNVQNYSVFGLFSVPARFYAWALLVFWQLLLPGLSFLGHLSGILIGQMYVWGWLNALQLSETIVSKMERSLLFAYCMQNPTFILMTNTFTDGLPTHSQPTRSGQSGWSFGSFYRRMSDSSSGDGGGTSSGQSASESQGRFPGQAKYLTGGEEAVSAIPVIAETSEENENFDRLLEMGFDAPSARAALLTSNGDFTIAMNKLTGKS